MKLVKKFLRLLPIFFIVSALISCIFYNINLNQNGDAIEWFNIENGNWDNFIQSFDIIISITPFNTLIKWVEEYLGPSYFVFIAFYIMTYELFLSILFIMFDCINFVFIWANKFVNKGVDLD